MFLLTLAHVWCTHAHVHAHLHPHSCVCFYPQGLHARQPLSWPNPSFLRPFAHGSGEGHSWQLCFTPSSPPPTGEQLRMGAGAGQLSWVLSVLSLPPPPPRRARPGSHLKIHSGRGSFPHPRPPAPSCALGGSFQVPGTLLNAG